MTAYANLAKDVTYEDVKAAYDKYYDKEYFVRVLPKDVCPVTRWVEGSNFVDIGFKIEPSCSSISGVCLCVPTPYAFILSLTSQKRLATFAPLPAPLVPLLASMIIVSGLIIPSFTSGYNVRIDVVV